MQPSKTIQLMFILLQLLPGIAVAAERIRILEIESLPVMEATTNNTPIIDGNWQKTTLPYLPPSPSIIDLDNSLVTWFKVRIPPEIDNFSQPALYIWRHNIRISVYAEQQYIGGTAENVWGQTGIGWNKPLLLNIPAHQSPTFLYIKLEAGPSGAWLSPLIVGDRVDLLGDYSERYLLQVTASQWAVGISLVLSIFSLWLWSKRRLDRLYLQFSILSFLGCITNAFGAISFIPIDLSFWLRVVHTSLDWSSFLLVSFTVNALKMEKLRWLPKALLILAIIATFTHILVPDKYFFKTAYPILVVEQLAIFYVAVLVILQTFSKRKTTSLWFSVAYAGMVILQTHDFYGAFIASTDVFIEGSNWSHLSLPLLIIAFYAHLITRFVSALNESESLTTDLEQRVATTRAKLEASYSENQRIELKAATDAQRMKIYRDLHDDVGSKLVTILHQQPDAAAARLVRDALESLRASVYRANHGDEALDQFVASISEEVALRIESAGLDFECQIAEQADSVLVSANTAYHVTRILRELVSNVLHHAHAKTVRLEIRLESSDLVLTIADDGVGSKPWIASDGGIAHIQSRVEELGGVISYESTHPGVRTTFRVELGSKQAQSHPNGALEP